MQTRAGFDDHARGFHAGAMARDARQMAVLQAAIAIHDDRKMLRQTAGIQFVGAETFRFFTAGL